MARKNVSAKIPVEICPVCHKKFYRIGDYQRHIKMIKLGIDTENKKRHSKLF